MKILVVEDEERIASFLLKGLRAEGYVVEHAPTGAEALAIARRGELDLVVLDLGLGDMDGNDVLRQLRGRGGTIPVVVLTARGEVADRVESLDLGADDYLTKPFAFAELVARIRARLRPAGARAEPLVLQAGPVALDVRARRATVDDRAVELSAREFELLETFMRHGGQVLSREQLLSQVWGFHFDPGSNVVDVYVGYLRQKLGKELFETVRGVGYRFTAPALAPRAGLMRTLSSTPKGRLIGGS
jgi:DNA-binding response OmpR family regulator